MVVVTEGGSLYACPVHAGTAIANAATTSHAMHGGDVAPSAGEHQSKSHQCACMGDCCTAAPAAPVTVRHALADVAIIDALAATAVPAVSLATGPVPYALPFANGPPVSLLA